MERNPSYPMLNLAAFVVIAAGLKASRPVVVPFLLAIVISVICCPLLFWLKRRKIGTTVALSLVLLLVVIVASLFGALLGSSISDFSATFPQYQGHIQDTLLNYLHLLEERGIKIGDKTEILKMLNPSSLVNFVTSFFSELGSLFANSLLILLCVCFMLVESSSLPDKLRKAFGVKSNSEENFHKVAGSINRYMALKTWISAATAALVAIMFWILGVRYPLVWGLFVFLFSFIPNIGAIIAALPPLLLTLVDRGATSAGIALGGYAVIVMVMGNLVETKVMGEGLGLSGLIVFLSVIFWGWLLGPVGMLLSVPLTMAVKIGLEANVKTKWLAIMLGQ